MLFAELADDLADLLGIDVSRLVFVEDVKDAAELFIFLRHQFFLPGEGHRFLIDGLGIDGLIGSTHTDMNQL
jgi:hypothetical protein